MRIDEIDISLNKREKIYKQLFNFIKGEIISGNYSPGDILPSSRKLAADMKISRTSVFSAYNSLIAEGYVTSLVGSGYRINALPTAITSKKKDVAGSEVEVQSKRYVPFNPEPVDLTFFPSYKWSKITSKIGREKTLSIFSSNQYDKSGIMELREAICTYLHEIKGIESITEQIVITSGTMESIEICVNFLTKSGDTLGIEDPCYPPMLDFLSKSLRKLDFMHIDREGACSDTLSSDCRAAIITPDCQFPLGVTMSHQRRIEFIKWASENERWIIEDNYDSDFNSNYNLEKSLFSLDQGKKTIYLGSFSRLITSELRVGYIVLPMSLLNIFLESDFVPKVSAFPQIILSEFMKSGEFYRNLVKVRKMCLEKKQYTITLLNEHLFMYGHPYNSHAGSFVVFLLKPLISDKMFVLFAKDRGLDLKALSPMSHDSGYNGLLMGFIYFNREVLKKSVALLKDTLALYCKMHKIDTAY